MGDFWTKYRLDNNQRMSPAQIRRVDQLEAEIAYHEHRLSECVEAIANIKRGGKRVVEVPKVEASDHL